jgi:hypothetical protein
MVDSIPLMGIGNLSMTMGMVCWSVLGGQDRWNVATMWSLVCSFSVTIPLALIFSYKFDYGVQGIVASLAIGYSLLGSILLCIVARSDWAKISKCIQEDNAESSDESSNPSSKSVDESNSVAMQSKGSSSVDTENSTPRYPRPLVITSSHSAPSDEVFADDIELQAGFQSLNAL